MPGRVIQLSERADGRWEARDLNVNLSALGATRREALDTLDEVVDAATDDGGHEPTNEELRAVGVDPWINHLRARIHGKLDDLREESVYAADVPEDPAILNEGADGDRTLDDIFDTESEEKRELRNEHPSGWLHLTKGDVVPILVDALLNLPPEYEFTENELADHAGVKPQIVGDYTDLLIGVELIEEISGTSPRRYQVADSDVVCELFELNSALNNVADD